MVLLIIDTGFPHFVSGCYPIQGAFYIDDNFVPKDGATIIASWYPLGIPRLASVVLSARVSP